MDDDDEQSHAGNGSKPSEAHGLETRNQQDSLCKETTSNYGALDEGHVWKANAGDDD